MSANLRQFLHRFWAGAFILVYVTICLAACGSSGSTSGSSNSPLLIWTDSTRLPLFQLYQKSHPNVKMHIVTVDQTTYLTKLLLLNHTKSGWPDVVFDSGPDDIANVTDKQYSFAAPLNNLVPQSTLNNFAAGSMSSCTIDGKLYCLRNDLAQVVLWYNPKLMQQFGYTVPTTWEEYQALGLRLAKEHPGYVIGGFGDAEGVAQYFWPSGCPLNTLENATTVHINLSDPKCTRVANLLQPLVNAGVIAKMGPFDDGYVKLGTENKILMMPAASWYGDYVFKTSYKTPNGQLAAAPPLRWADESTAYTGAEGGGIYYISSHSQNLQAAANIAVWMATNSSPDFLAQVPTMPAYLPAADAWSKVLANDPLYASNPYPVLKQAANLVNPAWSSVRYDTSDTVASAIVAALKHNQPITSAFPALQTQLTQLAQVQGYTVVQQ